MAKALSAEDVFLTVRITKKQETKLDQQKKLMELERPGLHISRSDVVREWLETLPVKCSA